MKNKKPNSEIVRVVSTVTFILYNFCNFFFVSLHQRNVECARYIQALWRGYSTRKRLRNANKAFAKFQKSYRQVIYKLFSQALCLTVVQVKVHIICEDFMFWDILCNANTLSFENIFVYAHFQLNSII